jgi:hypothetical protein
MSDFRVVTVCNRIPSEPYYCFQEWRKSLGNHEPLIIQAIDTYYQGLCDKPKFVYRAIKRGLIPEKYIVFCDSWDLAFCSPISEIIARFLSMDCDLAISAERNCFPSDLKEEYDKLPATSSFKYLNSGMIVGYTDKLLEALEAMDVESVPDDYWDGEKNIHFNDQFEYQKIMLKQPVNIKLDYDCLLSMPLHQVKIEDLDFSEERIRNIETNSYPCSMHMNGSSKTDGLREPILRHLKLI